MNTPEKQAKPKKYTLVRLIREYLRRGGMFRYFIPLHLVAVFAVPILQSFIPRASGFVIDKLIQDSGYFIHHLLLPYSLIIIGVSVVYYLLEFFKHVFTSRLGVEVKAQFQLDLYGHLLHLSEDFYHRTQVGEISTRLTRDMDNGVDPLYRYFTESLWGILTIISSAAILYFMNSSLFFLYSIGFAIWYVLSRFLYPVTRKISRDLGDRFGKLNGRMTEGISSQELIRAFAKEKEREDELEKEVAGYVSQSLKLRKYTSGAMGLMLAVQFYLFPLLALYVCATVLQSTLTAGEVVAAYGLWIAAAMPLSVLVEFFPGIARGLASLDRIFEFFDETPLINDSAGSPGLSITTGEIRFDAVSFNYPLRDTQIVLQDLNLTFPPRSRTAIVGQTGSGKSTIISLILRLYDPDTGAVQIDGQNLKSVSQQSIREQIGLVMQETILWSGTVRDNLSFAKPGATDAEMIAALTHAELWGFIQSTKDMLDTVVGERGVRLSGGQKQRLAIARVFLMNPRIVIMDEATSSLDSITEKSIQDTMEKLLHGRTAIIVAHRLSTIINCEHIVVLESGRITAQGNHASLLESSDTYRGMCLEQRLAI